MPTTSKGIRYPGPNYPPSIVEDMTDLGNDALNRIDNLAAHFNNGLDVVSNPVAYASAPIPDLCTVQSGPNSDFLLWVQFAGQWKKVATATTSAAIFLNGNQLKGSVNNGAPVVQEVADATAFSTPGFYGLLYTTSGGLAGTAAGTVDTSFTAPTGFVAGNLGAPVYIFGLAPGAYTVEVKYKSTAGNVVLGQRFLMAGVMKVM